MPPPSSRDGSRSVPRRTLPPPVLAALEMRADQDALARRTSTRAEEGSLRVAAGRAMASGDDRGAHNAICALARALAKDERALGEAIALAERALAAGEDLALRVELAGWKECVGDHAGSALELERVAERTDDPSLFVRGGVMRARAGDAAGAAVSFARAAALDPEDATACELAGTLAAWAPEKVPPKDAARSFIDASARRSASTQGLELEHYARAFESDAASNDAATAFAAALAAAGRDGAADEVLRAHADALLDAGFVDAARERNAARMERALASGNAARALGAALDDDLDSATDDTRAAVFDGILLRAGLLETLAVRLELRAESARGAERAHMWLELARLLAGPLANAGRAVRACAEAVAAWPSREAIAALRAYAVTARSADLMMDALVRGVQSAGDAEQLRAGRIACARALAHLADERGATVLASWASAHVVAMDPNDAAAIAFVTRSQDAVRRKREELSLARRALEVTSGEARKTVLREIAAVLREMPDAVQELSHVLVELVSLVPDDAAIRDEAARVAWRLDDVDMVLALVVPAHADIGDGAEAARAFRAKGDTRAALDAVLPGAVRLEDGEDPHVGARIASLAWAHAVRARDARSTATALAALATDAPTALHATLYAAASDRARRDGDKARARRYAERACAADHESAHAVVALAASLIRETTRTAASAVERAILVAVPRGILCESLARSLDVLGERDHAIGWTQRLVALRPGDISAVKLLLDRVMTSGDAARIGDAIGWILAQPLPVAALVDPIARALMLLAELEPPRAAVFARRALDSLGPTSSVLRAAIARAAERAKDDALGATLLLRWVASDAPVSARGSVWTEIAAKQRAAGNTSQEAHALARALRGGVNPESLAPYVNALPSEALTPDAELAWLESRALVADEATTEAAALRKLGAALWDMSDDHEGAVKAWIRAARLSSARGYSVLRRDMTRFGDAHQALDCLAALVDEETEPARSGAAAAEAARAALEAGARARAVALARVALERNAERADALEIAEQATAALGRAREMSSLYDAVANRAPGRFGRRAAHYRGARFFESNSEPTLAWKHASAAFVAVPSEGSTLVMLARTSERAAERAAAVKTVENVAELARTKSARAAWLLRAAAMTTDDEDGLRQRVDVVLRATVMAPDPVTLSMLSDAARALLTLAPDERDGLSIRLARAEKSLASKLDGPEGARVSVAFAVLDVEMLDDAAAAWISIVRAMEADGDVEQFESLLPFVKPLAAAENARESLAQAMKICDKPFANVGAPALKLIGEIADLLGDRATRGKAMILAAASNPDDDALVVAGDEARTELGDEALSVRFDKRVDRERLSEATRAVAKKILAEGDADRAVGLLGRAAERASVEMKPEVEREIADAISRSGSKHSVTMREVASASLSPQERAAKWIETAERHTTKSDYPGALDALERAVAADGSSLDAKRLLARALEDALEPQRAEPLWREILSASPDHDEADVAIESRLASKGEYQRLAEHLAERAGRLAQRADQRDALRALRLRRAALFEQRLGDAESARAELEKLLVESPGHDGAMRYLADIYERLGDSTRALELLASVGEQIDSTDFTSRADVGLKTARAALAAGDFPRARSAVMEALAAEPNRFEHASLRVDIARASQDTVELGDALEMFAQIAPVDSVGQSEILIESAQAAARAGNTEVSLRRAQLAAKRAPSSASAQLFARGLEYKLRGAGAPDDAKHTMEALEGIVGPLEPEDIALRAFLYAEAVDAVQGGGAGMHVLAECYGQHGPQPLVAVGIAERLVREGRFEDALVKFEEALDGNLLGLRRAGAVALAAAEAAKKIEDHRSAFAFFNEAAKDGDFRVTALRRTAQLTVAIGDMERTRAILRALAETVEGDDRAQVLAQLARAIAAHERGAAKESINVMREAVEAAPLGSQLRGQLAGELEVAKRRESKSLAAQKSAPAKAAQEEAPLSIEGPLPASVSEPPPLPVNVIRAQPLAPADLERAVSDASSIAERVTMRLASARALIAQGASKQAEKPLAEALADGSLEAADLLAKILDADPERAQELLRVRRQAVELAPGANDRLESLMYAARADRNVNYARALEHVLRAFDPGAGPIPPPPLAAQAEQPGMLSLLTRHSHEPAGEALGLLWDGAGAVFAKPAATYAITGLERVVPGPASHLARLCDTAFRLLDAPRLPLYVRRSATDPSFSIALLAQASGVIQGDVRDDSAALRHVLGQAMSGALRENALLLGLGDADARVMWNALLGAFGPPERGRALDRSSGPLAEAFWQSVPPRMQRKLRELLASAIDIEFDLVAERARQSGRRVGLFLCGDFAYSVRSLVLEHGKDPRVLSSPDAFEQLAKDLPSLADLYRLAVRPEYADARWQPLPPGSVRGTMSTRYRPA